MALENRPTLLAFSISTPEVFADTFAIHAHNFSAPYAHASHQASNAII